ncbi:MAG TPA: carbohydrate ABC transporter permease [Bauldia sp.]|nr:carbohydrate ABC transporter permease [Bauldia sp.]
MQKRNPFLTALGAFLILLFTGGPILLAFIGSVVPDRVMFDPNRGLFDEVTLENYRFIFTGELPPAYLESGANRTMISDAARQAPLSLWNSAQIAFASLVINLVLGAPAAFIYARYAFPGKKLSFMFLILSPLVPTVALITPIYIMIQEAGLIGSKVGIIFVHAAKALPFTVLILSIFFRKQPTELFEAATIDGCSRIGSFFRVAVPMALPALAATGLFAFMLSYAEFMFAMVLSGDASARTASVVMAALARNPDVSWSLLNAGIFIAILPTLILVALVWRFVIADLVRGAVKA